MTKMFFDLRGKIALITGSSQGIGFGIAQGLGQAGATIVLNGRNEEKLKRAVSTLSEEGLKVFGYPFDVSDSKQIDQKISIIEREVGPIHILVNNAGIQRRGPLETFEESLWWEVIGTNLTAVFLVSRRVAKEMIERRSGKIINICSLMSEISRPTIGPYTASKGGVKMLTKAMAVEWAKYNIQVNGIGPGFIVTEMNKPLLEDPKFDAMVRSRTPAGRWGQPSDLAGAAVFLASRASDYVTGQILYVEGGLLSAL
ncbi:MAG: SDR family oxidoreductase [Thermodesulfobacteriota bacterium]